MSVSSGLNSRRRWLGIFGGALAALGMAGTVRAAEGTSAEGKPQQRHRRHHQAVHAALARQEIMELRHAYGIATDLIGSNKPESVEQGRAIYHRIFTADAAIGAAGVDSVKGPDAWVDIVRDALAPYSATQHLIGTQHITGLVLPSRTSATGSAEMASYLQAWHSKANGELWLFMGTYRDELSWSAERGWQIRSMMLHQVAADYRQLGQRPD